MALQSRKDLLEKMSNVPQPAWENLYTLEWRCTMGSVLCDFYDSGWKEESLLVFTRLEECMPKFGFFWLYKAMLYARQGEKEKSDGCFILFAAKNPFSCDLWLYWSMAAKNQNADVLKMLETSRFYKKKYPHDLTPSLGEALALHILGKRHESVAIMKELQAWAKARFQKWPVRKNEKILEITEKYLEFF